MIKKKFDLPLILIFGFSLLLYSSAYIYVYNNFHISKVGDAQEYINCATNTFDRHEFYCGKFNEAIDFDLYTRRPPFYPLFILILLKLTQSLKVMLFFQNILVFTNAFILLKIMRMYTNRNLVKYLVLIGYFLYPAQIVYGNVIMAEIVLQTLLLYSFYLLIKYEKYKNTGIILLYNIVLTCAVLTKPVLLYFWIINLIIHIIIMKKSSKHIIFYSLIPLLAIGAWSARNYRVTGVFHFSSIKNHNLLNYNIRSYLTDKYDIEIADSLVSTMETDMNSARNYKEFYKIREEKVTHFLRSNIAGFSIHHMKGVPNFFIDPGRFDLYNFLQLDQSVSLLTLYHKHGYKGIINYFFKLPPLILIFLLIIIILNIVIFISFMWFVIGMRLKDFSSIYKPFLLMIILYIAVLTGPIGASRFRLPVYPFLLLTLTTINTKIANKKGHQPGNQ